MFETLDTWSRSADAIVHKGSEQPICSSLETDIPSKPFSLTTSAYNDGEMNVWQVCFHMLSVEIGIHIAWLYNIALSYLSQLHHAAAAKCRQAVVASSVAVAFCSCIVVTTKSKSNGGRNDLCLRCRRSLVVAMWLQRDLDVVDITTRLIMTASCDQMWINCSITYKLLLVNVLSLWCVVWLPYGMCDMSEFSFICGIKFSSDNTSI